MADDGLLLNFSVGESAVAHAEKLRGGNWRDRRATLKHIAGREKRKHQDTETLPLAANTKERTDDLAQSSSKRQKIDIGRHSVRSATRNERQRQAPRVEHAKQVISSLFTYNPESTSAGDFNHATGLDEDIPASNAPLPGELDNFTSLGLSKTIATHLTQKLDIKKPTAVQKAAIKQLVHDDEDVFIQAETGSGKTLAYLLPILQRITNLSRLADEKRKTRGLDTEDRAGLHLQRDSGLFAIILAPTRELARQIQAVLDSVLGCTRWIVSGTVIGGERKKSEKAKLRKGLNILIATPGRLADHLSHTEALNTSSVRWLVLDEGDRLMELGFEDDIKKIIGHLNLRMKAVKVQLDNNLSDVLPTRRNTILCSATMKMGVQRLGEISLKDAKHIHTKLDIKDGDPTQELEFTAPAQLKQSFIVAPAKQRLVTLHAFLRQSFARKGSVNKAIVFISCADSVNFHFDVFARASDPTRPDEVPAGASNISKAAAFNEVTTADSLDLSNSVHVVKVFRLHGSLPQNIRNNTLRDFHRSEQPSVLFCTDVASRGLDLPNVDLVIEFDPAFSREEHLHRIGRTARAGKEGRAVVFLLPRCEEGYVTVLSRDRPSGVANAAKRISAEDIIKKCFSVSEAGSGGKIAAQIRPEPPAGGWEAAATDWQLDVERWVLADEKKLELARKAYISHVRAYATHVTSERIYFDIKELQLGHLAKAFGLRDRPGHMRVQGIGGRKAKGEDSNRGKAATRTKKGEVSQSSRDDEGVQEASRKMRKLVGNQKLMTGGGADEFNIG